MRWRTKALGGLVAVIVAASIGACTSTGPSPVPLPTFGLLPPGSAAAFPTPAPATLPCAMTEAPLSDLASLEADLRTGRVSDASAETTVIEIEQELSDAAQAAGPSTGLGGAIRTLIGDLGLLAQQLNAGTSGSDLSPFLAAVDSGVAFVRQGCENAVGQVSAPPLGSAAPAVTALTGTDPCLVGTWTENEETLQLGFSGTSVTLGGGADTTYAFTIDGMELVTYDGSRPLEGPLGNALFRLSRSGSISYLYRVDGDRIVFVNAIYDRFSESATLAAQPVTMPPPAGDPAPVIYTCTRDSLIEIGTGFHVSMSR